MIRELVDNWLACGNNTFKLITLESTTDLLQREGDKYRLGAR